MYRRHLLFVFKAFIWVLKIRWSILQKYLVSISYIWGSHISVTKFCSSNLPDLIMGQSCDWWAISIFDNKVCPSHVAPLPPHLLPPPSLDLTIWCLHFEDYITFWPVGVYILRRIHRSRSSHVTHDPSLSLSLSLSLSHYHDHCPGHPASFVCFDLYFFPSNSFKY